jgi:hypothetical protein
VPQPLNKKLNFQNTVFPQTISTISAEKQTKSSFIVIETIGKTSNTFIIKSDDNKTSENSSIVRSPGENKNIIINKLTIIDLAHKLIRHKNFIDQQICRLQKYLLNIGKTEH